MICWKDGVTSRKSTFFLHANFWFQKIHSNTKNVASLLDNWYNFSWYTNPKLFHVPTKSYFNLGEHPRPWPRFTHISYNLSQRFPSWKTHLVKYYDLKSLVWYAVVIIISFFYYLNSLRADVSYFLPPAEKGRLRNGVANRVPISCCFSGIRGKCFLLVAWQ